MSLERHDTFWTDPAEDDPPDLVDVELKGFLQNGQSALAYRLDDAGNRLSSQQITVWTAPGIVGFGLGADNLDPMNTGSPRGEMGQVLWHPRRLRWELVRMALWDRLVPAYLAGALNVSDGTVGVNLFYGSSATFTAQNLYNRSGSSGAVCLVLPIPSASSPSGTIFVLYDVVPVAQNLVTIVGYNLADGAWSYSTLATYSSRVGATSGPTEYIACSPAPTNAQRDNTTTSITSVTPSSSTWGQSVTIVANVAPAAGVATPTGNVLFTAAGPGGTVALGYALLDGSANATLMTAALPEGSDTIYANYQGDANYNTSSASQSFTVAAAGTTTALTIYPSSATYGQMVTLTAAVTVSSPGAGTATGTIAFKDGSTTLASVTTASGTCYFNTVLLGAGSHSLSAVFTPSGGTTTTSTGSGSIAIAQAQLTVSAQAATMTYGAAVPAGVPAYSGFVNGDSAGSALTGAASFSTSATSTSAVGSYSVTVGAGSLAAANYSFSFTPGTLVVSAAPLTCSANMGTMRHGTAVPALTASLSGVLNGDSLTTSCVTDATSSSPPGTYAVSPSVTGANVGNYRVTYQQAVMNVT